MLEGLVAPLRVVWQRSFADWLIVAAVWLVIVCATTLVAVGVLYGDAVALTGLHRILADEPGTSTSISVQIRASADELPEVEPKLERQIGRILGWTGGELITVARSETYELPGGEDSEEVTSLVIFGAYEGIEEHATLLDGAWPDEGEEPMAVAVSRSTADALGLEVGSELAVASRRDEGSEVSVLVTGIWQPTDPTDPYWRADPLELEGASEGGSFVTFGPLVVGREDLLGRTVSGDIDLELRALPDFDQLALDDVRWMRSDVAALERRLEETLGDRAFFQVGTELDEILEAAGRSLLVSRSGVLVVTIQFAVLAAYALLLVAGLMVEQRRVETALLRSRGAGVRHIALMSFLEAMLLVVPAVLLAPWLALAILGMLNFSGPLAEAGITIEPRIDSTVVLVAIGAGLAATLGLVLPALGAGRGLASVRQSISRQGNRSLAQRLGLDLALVVLAGIGLWQLRQYGAPLTQTVRGTIGLDPLLVAAPAIALLAGSILALRIVPLAAELGERLLVGQRGLVGPLGARQLSRRPLRYTRAALLLMLAAALGTFAGAYASTWTQSQADQAAYRTGSDVRVEVARFADLPSWAIGQSYRTVEGVEEAIPVAVDRFDLAQARTGTILAIDSADAAAAIEFRPDLADEPIDDLLARLTGDAPASGTPLDEGTVAFALEVTPSIEPLIVNDESVTFSPGFRGITPAIVMRDADGIIHRVTGPRMAVGLGAQSVEIPVTSDAVTGEELEPAFPAAIIGVELAVELPAESLGVGSVTLDGLELLAADGAALPVDLGTVPPMTFDAEDALPGFGPADPSEIEFSVGTPAAEEAGPVPVLASEEYLAATGAAIGDTVELGQLTERRQFTVVGSLRGFPTVDPAEPFVIADIGALATADEASGSALGADEWWLATAEGAGPSVAETIRAEPYSVAAAVARDDLHRDLIGDPVALGVIGALVIGALAAIIFAAIGFVVSATVSARERLGEFALLQAIGLSHRQLSAWLTIENAFLLLIGLLAGTGLGLVLAWVVLPFVTLTQEATLAVPPVDVVFPWGVYGVLYLAALVALVVTVVVIGRLLGRVRVSGVLRAGGE